MPEVPSLDSTESAWRDGAPLSISAASFDAVSVTAWPGRRR
jgi:hypothetical protein